MAIKLSINNVIIFVTSLLPILIGSFFIINSFFNYDLKGLIWLIGLLLASGISMLLKNAGHGLFPEALHPWIREVERPKQMNYLVMISVKYLNHFLRLLKK